MKKKYSISLQMNHRIIETIIETYILSNKLYDVVNIYTKSVGIKIYNMYIFEGLRANLKLVSAFFYQIFIFSPNDNPSKTIKNVFYFI